MPVTELRVQGYRSIHDLTLPLKRVNVIVGPNGCGKSNLYQSVALLRSAADGVLARTLAEQGGLASVLWAGPRKEGPVRVRLGVTLDGYEYDLEIGLPTPSTTMFQLDPLIKSEVLRQAKVRRPVLERGTTSCTVVDADGALERYTLALRPQESALVQIADPTRYPQLDDLRRKLLSWRFYHGFRTDSESPLRKPQTGTRTYVLAGDGRDLASALQTIRENGDDLGLDAAVQDAFPGSRLLVLPEGGGLTVAMEMEGIARPMSATELSDGTLRYLCLLAALLSPQPAPLLALNEPETSLHEGLLPALARLIGKASETSQIWLTTHSHILAERIEESCVVKPIALHKVDGETQRVGRSAGAAFHPDDAS